MKDILIYDGDCPFCNKTVLQLAKLDSDDKFCFVSNLSRKGKKILKNYDIDGLTKLTIIIIINDEIYIKSRAILKFLSYTKKYFFVRVLLCITPLFVSDKVYDFISNNRKKIIKNKCEIPNENIIHKFEI